MLPLQQAYEVKHSILEYLKATFSFKDKAVHKAFYQFLTSEQDGIFKGPYISLKLPFVKATNNDTIPLDIKPNFPPYDHQYKSFQRLSTTNGHQPQSTLITTGTSSGKTECFLYPILDYCYKNQHRNGIKVIIMYPMNALATDQAKRLAEAIWSDTRLKGKITAGLFIGEGKDKQKFSPDMGENHIIENRNSIVDSPPDILLTNFKMLDYALMRNTFHNLWTYNLEDTSLLKFLVLDELHTYDGAQGTDVANLIRRLKLKLTLPKGQLCAVGTSATIGSGEESKQLLTEYASKVFGENFDNESIITENRISVNEFFSINDDALETYIPRQIGLLESRLKEDETYESYIIRQKRLWQLPESLDAEKLGEELKKLKLVKDLINLSSHSIKSLEELLRELAYLNPDFKRLPEWDEANQLSPREEVINSLLALISEARVGSDKKFPFLYLQIQIWIRELSGILREFGSTPKFTWKDKAGTRHDAKALPSYFCRECGASGWLGVKDDNKNHFSADPKQVYDYFFENHKNVYFVNTEAHKHVEEYEPTNAINGNLNVIDLALQDRESTETLKIHAVRKLDTNSKAKHVCPECNTENSLGVIGTRIATLSSITVSQVLSSDLDPRTEKYRKILAFTNSVQDAAHQAGFVEARNYRFTFRSSLQKVINQLGSNIVSISELQQAFIDYWKQHADETGNNQEQAYYYRFFPADYKARVDINTDYRIGNKFTETFKREFDERMRWEITSEFGFSATIGRTLEKSGASAVKFEEQKLREVFVGMEMWLQQNNLLTIKEADLLPFINGILHRIRIRGGIDHEYLSKFRNEDLRLRDLNWNTDNRHFLNRYFGERSRLPKLLTTEPHNRGILDTTFTNTNNWYRSYFIKSFQMATNHHAIVNDFYKQLFDILVSVEILNKVSDGKEKNYAIVPTAIFIEKKVKQYQCDTCGSTLNVAQSDQLTNQTKCLDYNCKGSYKPNDYVKPNYYQLVYNRKRSPRIYAAEHTGILERKDRENKEIDFKERPNFNSLNAIVATSTLEMGIDIGTLNSAINNSVPPLTSNFLQRVGRAGRSSGSALITTFAQSKAHDLFYYEQPSDMMEGEIASPGCYLEAKDILYRHFFAYCLDNWTSSDPKNHSIPGIIISLRLSNTDLSNQDFLPNRIISYIKSNEDNLLEKFESLYKPDLSDVKVLKNLREYLIDETFYIRIRKVFSRLKDEYLNIQEKRAEIDKIIKTNKLSESDEERKILEAEKKALWGLKRLIDKRSILEHLTNIGLLPNYAFPETGVTLNAWVKSSKAKASESMPSDKQFEIVRSSSVAIREFAPDNFFYSQGHKFAVSGLNTFDWKDAGVLMRKRFCSNCDHIADAAVSTESHCPKCSDPSWSSVKNQHIFVKLSSVKSVNTRENSTLDDSSDDRQANHYVISKHIKFDKNSFQGAWGMKDIPFGIEYVKNVDITVVNLGLSSSADANKVTINQHENIPYHGFVTCKYCGKSSSEPHRKKSSPSQDKNQFHFGYCKHKDKEYQGKSDEFFEEVYLFKEIKTEGLKVLLPVQDMESETQINMFKAGMELGLKKYYKGNPQHLGMLNYAEYNSKNSRFDRYLVIHDNIPGGTGYLEKLFNTTEFTKVITLAYNAIKECSCQFKGKDGCYRCVYTYSNQSIQEELSRTKAEKLFKKIVEKSNAWENYTSGLGSLSGNGQIEESELEDRLIRSIRNFAKSKEEHKYQFESFIEDSVVNYKLKIVNGDYSFYYIIRPQIELGPTEGVKFKTRSDFYISLTAAEKGRIPLENIEFVKGIAVYLDGYTFHATKENNRFENDLQKRIAIVASGNKITWTLTWADIERFEATERDNETNNKSTKNDSIKFDRSIYKSTISKFEQIPYWNKYKSELIDAKNSLERLLWLLANPLEEQVAIQKINLSLALQQKTFAVPSIDEDELDKLIYASKLEIEESLKANNKAKGNFYIFPEIQFAKVDFYLFKVAIKIADLSLKASIFTEKTDIDLDKSQWERFWQIFNLIQTDCRLLDKVSKMDTHTTDESMSKYDCLIYHDTRLHEIIKQLIDNNIDFNKEGGFYIEYHGDFAEAMLGFEDKKYFINPLSSEDKRIFEQAGFTELSAIDFTIKALK